MVGSEEGAKRRMEVFTRGSWIGVPLVTRFPCKVIFECLSIFESPSSPQDSYRCGRNGSPGASLLLCSDQLPLEGLVLA